MGGQGPVQPGPIPGGPVRPPQPQLAQPSIPNQASGMVREPGGPVQQQQQQGQPQESDFLDRVAAVDASKLGREATQQAILQAVAANAPEGSPIRMLAQIFQAGILGRQEAQTATRKAAVQDLTRQALERGAKDPEKFLSGAAALMQLDDTKGAELLFDRYDATQAAADKARELVMKEERNRVLNDASLSTIDRNNRLTELREREVAIKEQAEARAARVADQRTAIMQQNADTSARKSDDADTGGFDLPPIVIPPKGGN